jgi:hypothetical protein
LTDASGNVWTLPNGVVTENGQAVPDGAGTQAFAIVDGKLYGEDAHGGGWYTYSTQTKVWTHSSAPPISPTPTPTPTPTPGPTPTPTPTPIPEGVRDPFNTPFASDSVFNLPLGLGAQWQSNDQLSHADVFINTVGNYNENIWKGTASDPVVTITNNASAGGTPGVFHVHIPAGAMPAAGGDQTFSVDDTTTHTWYSFGGFNWTGPDTATARQGSGESDFGSGLQVDGSNWDQGVGTLREHDLQAGTIDHMLRLELPFNMLKSWDPNSTTNLAPYAWPQTAEDGFAINGNGNPPYTGTVPFGVTIGIAASAVEPADVAANAGADMLWKALQHHGAMVRDSTATGNNVVFQADQNVDPNDPLIQGMEALRLQDHVAG